MHTWVDFLCFRSGYLFKQTLFSSTHIWMDWLRMLPRSFWSSALPKSSYCSYTAIPHQWTQQHPGLTRTPKTVPNVFTKCWSCDIFIRIWKWMIRNNYRSWNNLFDSDSFHFQVKYLNALFPHLSLQRLAKWNILEEAYFYWMLSLAYCLFTALRNI